MAVYAFGTASGSSTTGTYSTTYKSSQGSVVSSEADLASKLLRMELSSGLEEDEEKLNKIERAKRLVKEFCYGNGDIGAVVERWLSEMGVGWVLGLTSDTSLLLRAQRDLKENWIQALMEIMGSTVLLILTQDVPEERDMLLGLVQLLKETVLKMLPFVDALLAAGDLDATNEEEAPSVEKLRTLVDVRVAMSRASEGIKLCFGFWLSVEMEAAERGYGDVVSLLLAKEERLDETIWNTMEEVRTSILNDDDSTRWGIKARQGSPDICRVTRSLVTYIEYLCGNYQVVYHIVCTAAKLGNYVPSQDETDPLSTLIMEMVSSLQLKLNKRSKSFPNHSLRFLFLINNTHFLAQHIHPTYVWLSEFHKTAFTLKIEDYIQKYLQVSWEPVLSCLYNHTPRWFRKKSALLKFDLEFRKTYNAQKLWKVPDIELRERLRQAIIEKVVPDLTRYLEDNNVTNPGVTPQEREEMLLELFEG
ncbi:unnamed protein product [Urochloa humidicola]